MDILEEVLTFLGDKDARVAWTLQLTAKVYNTLFLRNVWFPLSRARFLDTQRFNQIRFLIRDAVTIRTVLPRNLIGLEGLPDPNFLQLQGPPLRFLRLSSPVLFGKSLACAEGLKTLELTASSMFVDLYLPKSLLSLTLQGGISALVVLRALAQHERQGGVLEKLVWLDLSKTNVQHLKALSSMGRQFPRSLQYLHLEPHNPVSSPITLPVTMIPSGITRY